MLRLPASCKVDVEIGEINQPWGVAPLLILPFIENAFKHSTHSQLPSFVQLHLHTEERQLHVQIHQFGDPQ